MSDKRKSKIWELDYLRSFAIIGVIIIHSTGRLWWFPYIKQVNALAVTTTFSWSFAAFAVSLFIFISGFVHAYIYKNRDIGPIGTFYLKKLLFILPPYVLFAVIYHFYYIIKNDGEFTLIKLVFNMLTAGSAYHLWYIAVIIQIYLLYPLIQRLYNRFENHVGLMLGISFFVQFAWCGIKAAALHYFVDITSGSDLDFALSVVLERFFLSHIGYFILGMFIAGRYERFKERLSAMRVATVFIQAGGLLLWCAVLTILTINHYYDLFAIPFMIQATGIIVSKFAISLLSGLLFFYISYRFILGKMQVLHGILAKISAYSFGIYLTHVILLEVIARVLVVVKIHPVSALFYVLLLLITIIMSYVTVKVLCFFPKSEYIIGIKRKSGG